MHIGKMQIASTLLLKWLHFEGGEIRAARLSPDMASIVELIIEHPEIPEVLESKLIPIVTPEYITNSQETIREETVIRKPIKR